MSILDTLERWLPVTTYQFVGGPVDGQILEVSLYETDRGVMPPDVWSVADPLPPPKITSQPPPAPRRMSEIAINVSRYRFRPRPGKMNQGHYEFIP